MNEADYKLFFYQNYKLLCNYIYNLTHDMALAEDIVQDVFIKVWEKDMSPIEFAYVIKSCKNKLLEHLRKEKALKKRETGYTELQVPEEENPDKYVKINRLNTLIRQLPPKTQEVFILNKFNGLTYSQIAELKNLSVKTIENQIGQAYKFVRSNW